MVEHIMEVNKKFHCCMDCGPDIIDQCKLIGCQVIPLVMKERHTRIGEIRMTSKKRFVIWHPENNWGEFEFCCSTQANYCTSLKKAKEELIDKDYDWEDGEGNSGYNLHPNEYHIYEITLKRMKGVSI